MGAYWFMGKNLTNHHVSNLGHKNTHSERENKKNKLKEMYLLKKKRVEAPASKKWKEKWFKRLTKKNHFVDLKSQKEKKEKKNKNK